MTDASVLSVLSVSSQDTQGTQGTQGWPGQASLTASQAGGSSWYLQRVIFPGVVNNEKTGCCSKYVLRKAVVD